MEDLQKAIRIGQVAVDAISESHPDRAQRLNSLGIELRNRYQRTGSIEDLQEAIRITQAAVEATPTDHPDRAQRLDNLGVGLRNQYLRTRSIEYLQEAIRIAQTAVDATPENHPDRAQYLSNLGTGINDRYQRTGSIEDLQETIRITQTAVEATPEDHPDRALHLNNLGFTLRNQYLRTRSIEDLQKAIRIAQAAVNATPEDHPNRARRLNNLGTGFGDRYQRTGLIEDLQEAIRIAQAAVNATPQDHPDRARYLDNLGIGLGDRYLRTELIEDFEEIIYIARAVVDAAPESHPDRARYLNNLGVRLGDRYLRTGSMEDLQEAIHIGQAAVDATPEKHPDRAQHLNNLGIGLGDRYLRTESIEDLQEAIRIAQAAVDATPENHLDRVGNLNNLGIRLSDRYHRTGSKKDLQEATRIIQVAVDATPQNHLDRARLLNNLGNRLHDGYLRTRSIEDLHESIRIAQAAVNATPKDHPDQARHLNNLGNRLHDGYLRTRSIEDLHESIRIAQAAVNATPKDHPDRARYLNNLGSKLRNRSQEIRSAEDLQKALTCFIESLHQLISPPTIRLESGIAAAEIAIGSQDWREGALHLENLIDLLPKIVPRSNSHDDFQYVLRQVSGLGSLTASVFLQAGKSALESLQAVEKCRGVIASLMVDSRSDISLLRQAYPDMWSRYHRLREAVAASAFSTNRRSSTLGLLLANDYASRSLKLMQDVKELGEVENEIRKQPGFERFQLAPTESEIYELARYGPIVSFNVTHLGSHAFLITGNNVRVLQLPKLNYKDLEKHASKTPGGNRSQRPGTVVSLDGNSKFENLYGNTQTESMHWLWDAAIKLALEELGLLWQDKRPATLPCVWWVGGGLMAVLPLHAAGKHQKDSTENTVSHVISSYAPTLKVLQFSQKKAWTPLSVERSKILIVTMPKTPGLDDLNVDEEVTAIRQHVGSSTSVEILKTPTAAAVLEQVTVCSLVHFACHCLPDTKEPSKSALLLGAENIEKLTVENLLPLNHQLAQVAYLSACSTAEIGARNLIDESIHLASTFQLVGFRHVIGTLWEAYDLAAIHVAAKFYEYLLKQDADTASSVPRALHHAILHLRDKGKNRENISLWAPFIHVGP